MRRRVSDAWYGEVRDKAPPPIELERRLPSRVILLSDYWGDLRAGPGPRRSPPIAVVPLFLAGLDLSADGVIQMLGLQRMECITGTAELIREALGQTLVESRMLHVDDH